jgi:hypothetical protein
VKVRKVGGHEQLRIFGVANTTDKGARRQREETRAETVEVLLIELRHALDKEFRAIDALDHKGGIILGSASLVVALMTAAYGAFFQRPLQPNTACLCLQVGLVAAAAVYIRLMYCAVRGFRVTTYYLPLRLDEKEIHNAYLGLNKAEVREQLLANYIKYSALNSTIIDKKAAWVEKALSLLAADTAYPTVLVIVGTLILGS